MPKPKAERVEDLHRAIRILREQLNLVIVDCDMALSGEWDRSDDGFKAMKELSEQAINQADLWTKNKPPSN